MGLLCLGILAFLAPIAYSAIGTHGYFLGERCTCGFQSYYRIKENALWTYSPGHGETRVLYTLQAHDGVWDAVRDGKVVLQLKLARGAILKKTPQRSEWQSHPRVLNVWRVWIEDWLSSERAGEMERFVAPDVPAI